MPALVEVLEFLDDSGHTLVKRMPDEGECEIKWGAQLTVRESQAAAFFRDGKIVDVFQSGRYTLHTDNFPVITKWVTSFAFGPKSPFRAEVYFLNMKLFPNLKWGTPEPILFKDSELQMVRLRANGIFSIEISDPNIFLNTVVGTQGLYDDEQIGDYLRNLLISKITVTLANNLKTVLDVQKEIVNLSTQVKNDATSDFAGLGLTLHDFSFNSISVPPEVQQMIDTRTDMSAIGNMDDFVKYKAAMAMQSAAENPNGAAGAGAGLGAGMGVGMMMPQMMQNAMQDNSNPQTSPAVVLKQLKDLLDAGAITQEEYDGKKAELLKKI